MLASGVHFIAFSQTDTIAKPGNRPAHQNDSTFHIHSLFSGIGSGSNMIFLGSTISKDKPFYSAALTYGYRNSLYVSASASHLTGISPYMAFYTLSINYNHAFNSWLDISSSIAGYKTPESLHEKLFSDFAFLNLTAGLDWKLLYTKLSFGGIISDYRRGYIQIRNSRYFETPEFFNGKGQITFDPNVNMLFGDIVKIKTVTGIKYGSTAPFRHFRRIATSTTDSYSYVFGVMDFEFSLPVTFNYDKFSLEPELNYILPAQSNSDYPAPKGFTFFLNAFFRIL